MQVLLENLGHQSWSFTETILKFWYTHWIYSPPELVHTTQNKQKQPLVFLQKRWLEDFFLSYNLTLLPCFMENCC